MGLSKKTKIPFDYSNRIEIGDVVCKRSRKPFQNGKRLAQVVGYTLVSIPDKVFPVGALLLKGCDAPVTVKSVHYDQNELLMLSARDQRDELVEFIQHRGVNNEYLLCESRAFCITESWSVCTGIPNERFDPCHE